MKIANIVTTQKINISNYFNVVDSMDNITHGIPTLLVGFDYVNKHYPDFDIMEREIEPNLYWIFKKTEKRDEYEIGLRWFIDKILNDLIKNVHYVFVDIMQYKKNKLVKILRKILSINKIYSVINNDMIYIYGDNLIFGVDLKLFRFIGYNTDKIKLKVQQKSVGFYSVDDILIEDKNIINELGSQIRYLPYLESIKNE